MQLFRGYKTLRPAGLTALINRDNALVVDLRPMADFEKGHIVGSQNVKMSQCDTENKQLASAKSLPVVLACKTGQDRKNGGSGQRVAVRLDMVGRGTCPKKQRRSRK